MAKKQAKTFTADEIRAIKKKMIARRGELAAECARLAEWAARDQTFDNATSLRDMAEQLVALTSDLDRIDDTILLAEKLGPKTLFYSVEKYGLKI